MMSPEDREAWRIWSGLAPNFVLSEFASGTWLQEDMFRSPQCPKCGYLMHAEVHQARRLWLCMECDNAIYPT